MGKRQTPSILLFAVCMAETCAIIYHAWFFYVHGYLPSPFLNDKADTFMDFFNPMYWSNNQGRYTEWKSVYPPLNFLFLQLWKWLFIGPLTFSDGFALRASAIAAQISLVLTYLSIPAFILTRSYWESFSKKEKLLLYFAAIWSVPFLFGLERGNLIIISLFFLALLFDKSSYVKMISLAVLVNIKPYFFLLFLHYVVKRQWSELAIALCLSVGVFVFAGLALNMEFMVFFNNFAGFAQGESLFSLRNVMSMPSSISVFSYVIGAEVFQQRIGIVDRFSIDMLIYIVETLKWCVLGFALVALLTVKSDVQSSVLIALLLTMISNLGISVGGYTLTFYFCLIPILIGMHYRHIYIGILVTMSFPLDLVPIFHESIGYQHAYLSGNFVNVDWTLGIGSLVRPILNLFFLVCLAYEVFSLRKGNICKIGSNVK